MVREPSGVFNKLIFINFNLSIMKTDFLTKVNGVALQVAVVDGQRLIPIKPICEALGIDRKAQQDKLSEDNFLSSVRVLSPQTGADGKEYEMVCLPLQYIFGWLFTINPKNVKEEARETVEKYRTECYNALYNQFFGNIKKQIEVNEMEIKLLEEINEMNETKNKLTGELREKKTKVQKIREARLINEPSLFE